MGIHHIRLAAVFCQLLLLVLRYARHRDLIKLSLFPLGYGEVSILPQPFAVQHQKHAFAFASKLLHESVYLRILEMATFSVLVVEADIRTVHHNIKGCLAHQPLLKVSEVPVPPVIICQLRRKAVQIFLFSMCYIQSTQLPTTEAANTLLVNGCPSNFPMTIAMGMPTGSRRSRIATANEQRTHIIDPKHSANFSDQRWVGWER
mmetsp:Transcript_46349/g.110349  ORF Transcript_46349/g.110349 Transcript_46349/m.110349 type:complete len:204 (+) Transcript_46349:550-1161(+)